VLSSGKQSKFFWNHPDHDHEGHQDSGRRQRREVSGGVLRKIEGWHQGSIAGYLITYRDAHGAWHQISGDGKQASRKSDFQPTIGG
jgi:hypothetical protein